jgi:transcriptional regulator with PAS, ATPase and Fis domain
MAEHASEQSWKAIKVVLSAISDPWFLVDEEDRIIEFNGAFHALQAPEVARSLRNRSCKEVAKLGPCAQPQCLRQLCNAEGPIRLAEIPAEMGGRKMQMIVSAVPVPLAKGTQGALIVLRDVSDLARIQTEYRQLKDELSAIRSELEERLAARTRDLLASNEELNRLEKEIARMKRGGY